MIYKFSKNILNISFDDRYNNKNLSFFLDQLKINSKNKHRLLNNKLIIRNNEIINANTVLSTNDIISFPIYFDTETKLKSYKKDIDIVYEDELFLIVNKPCGILVHTDSINTAKTLSNIIQYYYDSKNLNISVRPIHRLDVNTSGLIIFSKSEIFQPILDKMLEEKKISRYYYALTVGYIKEGSVITIDKPIGKNRHKSNEYLIYNKGKKAQTTVKSLKYYPSKNQSLVECKLKTGRTHQIRVHLSSINHPIVNDSVYNHKSNKNMALQAYKIVLFHPLKEKEVKIEIPLRKDMK